MNFYLKLISLAAAFVLVVSACGGDSSDSVVEPTVASETPAPAEPTPTRTPVAETTPAPQIDQSVETAPTSMPEPTEAPTPTPVAEPTPTTGVTPVVEASPEPTPTVEVAIPTFSTPEATEQATPEVVTTPEPTAVVVATPESTPEATVEPTPVVTPEPTAEVTPEPEPIEVRLLSVEEILEADSRLVNWVEPFVPTGGNEEAELRACMELGDSVRILENYGGGGATLALCSTVYRQTTWAINYGLADPSCVHEQFRANLLQPFDPDRLRGWADVCYSQLDPNPDASWRERCAAIMGMVVPSVNWSADPFLFSHFCIQSPPEEAAGFGQRCSDLIDLIVAGLRAEAEARSSGWEVALDLSIRPADMHVYC